jgi:hypothetical protein
MQKVNTLFWYDKPTKSHQGSLKRNEKRWKKAKMRWKSCHIPQSQWSQLIVSKYCLLYRPWYPGRHHLNSRHREGREEQMDGRWCSSLTAWQSLSWVQNGTARKNHSLREWCLHTTLLSHPHLHTVGLSLL